MCSRASLEGRGPASLGPDFPDAGPARRFAGCSAKRAVSQEHAEREAGVSSHHDGDCGRPKPGASCDLEDVVRDKGQAGRASVRKSSTIGFGGRDARERREYKVVTPRGKWQSCTGITIGRCLCTQTCPAIAVQVAAPGEPSCHLLAPVHPQRQLHARVALKTELCVATDSTALRYLFQVKV